MRFTLLLLCLALVGCDKEVSRKRGEPVTIERSVSCTKADYCYTCGMGFNGKMDCGFKFSPMCTGSQQARITSVPVTITYESGHTYQTTEEFVDPLEACR